MVSSEVSIRCRARRTAELVSTAAFRRRRSAPSFYSLSCETYSGTMTSSPGGSRTPFSSSFYSLSCETYSGTRLGPRAGLVFVRRVGLLFAVVRDVQRNHHRWFVGRLPGHGFYSLRARRTAELVALQHATSRRSTFLFTVVRDVQRNGAPSNAEKRGRCFYSLSCETYSGTATLAVAIREDRKVSIRCRARRTAELVDGHPDQCSLCGFYSLSCETYSGTIGRSIGLTGGTVRRFLFAVVRDVQRNLAAGTGDSSGSEFLFAVVRDVQRNNVARMVTDHWVLVSIRCRARRTAEPFSFAAAAALLRFYSLSCETYSGTRSPRSKLRPRLSSRFYSLSCETYSGTGLAVQVTYILLGFLFAVVRDVQRNWQDTRDEDHPHVSIRCRARRTAEHAAQVHRMH